MSNNYFFQLITEFSLSTAIILGVNWTSLDREVIQACAERASIQKINCPNNFFQANRRAYTICEKWLLKPASLRSLSADFMGA